MVDLSAFWIGRLGLNPDSVQLAEFTYDSSIMQPRAISSDRLRQLVAPKRL